MHIRERKLLALLLSFALILTLNTAVFAGSSPTTYNINGWTVHRGSFSSKGIVEDMDKGIVNLTVPVMSRTTTKPATMEGTFPDLRSVYVDVVDLEELTTEVEIYVSEAPPVNLNFFSYKGSSAEIQVHTDGKASSRLFVKGTVSGEPEHYISISDNSSGDEGIKVNTEYGHIICKVSDTGDNLTEYKLDYICPIQDSISKNEPTGRITTYHHLPNDVCITYNAMVSAYVLYGTDKKNFRKELGDIEISRNGIRYVATDGKIVKLKHHDGGVWYEYFLQIKGMERVGFDPSGAVTFSGNSGLSKAEIMSDKKLLKAIKKATKKHHDNYENPLELGIYAYRLTGNMGDGDYQYTVEDYDILDTSVTVKFNVNGKTVKAVHGKKDQGDKQLVAYYSNDRYFKVESNSLSGSISMDKIPGVLN